MIRKKLKEYIENKIFKEYEKNEKGHGIEHIKYVIRRSLTFSKQLKNINEEMVYTIAAYHDIGHHIDKDNHEKISAEILLKDNNLKEFFTEEEIYEECMKHLNKKFGKNGYATKKMYFEDKEYKEYLKTMAELTENRKKFFEEMDRNK